MSLSITRTELTAEDLRRAARSIRNASQACRCLAAAVAAVIPEAARSKRLEIWFQDEARIGQKGTLA